MNLEKKYREVRDQSEHTLWGDLVCVVAIGLSASMQLIFFFFFLQVYLSIFVIKMSVQDMQDTWALFQINK